MASCRILGNTLKPFNFAQNIYSIKKHCNLRRGIYFAKFYWGMAAVKRNEKMKVKGKIYDGGKNMGGGGGIIELQNILYTPDFKIS